MKIQGFNNGYTSYPKTPIEGAKKNLPKNQELKEDIPVTTSIDFKSLSKKVSSLDTEQEINMAEIERLRAQLQSNPVTSELLAEALIGYSKENPWHRSKR